MAFRWSCREVIPDRSELWLKPLTGCFWDVYCLSGTVPSVSTGMQHVRARRTHRDGRRGMGRRHRQEYGVDLDVHVTWVDMWVSGKDAGVSPVG